MKYRFHIILTAFILTTIQSNGGYRDVFVRLGVENGLSQRWVRCIHQDKYGFIWLGTKDGLNKFDGSEFKIYRASDTNQFRLVNSTINDIHEEPNGNLWIATDRGLSIYQREYDNFISLPPLNMVAITCILKTKNGNFWLGSESGLFFMDLHNNIFKHFTKHTGIPGSLNANNILCLFEDSDHKVWIGTQRGVNILNGSDSTFMQLRKPDNSPWLYNLEVNTITEDKYGHIFIGTSGGGLDIYNKNQGISEAVMLRRAISDNIVSLFIDSKNRLFIGKGGGGGLLVTDVSEILTDTPFIKEYKNIIDDLSSLSDNSIESFFEDKTGDIWIGTYGNGVNLYSERNYRFNQVAGVENYNSYLSNKLVNSILEEKKYLWIGTENGLNRIDKKSGDVKLFIHEKNNPKSLGANAVYSILKDREGNLWIGTWNGGLHQYNYKSQDFIRYRHDNDNPRSISSNRVFKVYQDDKDRLWIGTIGGGLNQFDPITKSFIRYNSRNKQGSGLGTDYINDIIQTSDGHLWFSSFGALNLFDPNTQKLIQYYYNPNDEKSISDGDIMVLFEDSKSNLWVGCEGGLNYFDRENNQFIKYNTQNGLPNNSIKSIVEDNKGNLWLSTNSGITKFIHGTSVPQSPRFINFNKNDGLCSMEYIKRSAHKNNNILYFGGINGYTYFIPDSIYSKALLTETILTELHIFNSKVEPSKDNPILPKEIYLLDELNLSHKESVFTIKYTTLNFLNPQKVYYAYTLEGFDKDWLYVGNQKFATYTNIDAGNYIFKVKTLLNDTTWSKNVACINIHISPPWYQTLWFKISLLVFVISLIFLHSYFRTFRLTLLKKDLQKMVDVRTEELQEVNRYLEETKEEVTIQNEELSKHRNKLEKLVKERTSDLELALKKAKESDKLKSSFLANISHEIRTPMNAIIGFTAFLDDDMVSEESKAQYLNLINSNSKSLLLLLNDVIDQSLINSNQINLIPEILNVTEMLSDLEATYSIKNTKRLVIRFDNTDKNKPVYIKADKTRLKQCLSNILNNAYKFTHKGFIYFGYHIVDERIIFYVSDSGIGIAYKEREKIFNQFYKIEPENEKVYRGAGLGLSIAKHLVELMNGEIWFESVVNKGTTFYFYLPFTKDYFDYKTEPHSQNSNNYNISDYTILVAEDENANYLLIKEILLSTNANIVRAHNGAEAVNYVKNQNKNINLLILMDIKMPVMNGYSAYEKIKQINNNIPVIAVTAYATEPDLSIIKDHNFSAYLPKPFRGPELLKTIEKVIRAN